MRRKRTPMTRAHQRRHRGSLGHDEQSLPYQRESIKTITDNATVALFMMDESQRCTFMNPAAEALSGFSFREAQGRHLHELIHHTRPDGRPYPLAECPIHVAHEDGRRSVGREIFIDKNGRFFPVAFAASPIVDDARQLGAVVEVRDLTQEQDAEDRLATASSNLEQLYSLVAALSGRNTPQQIAALMVGQLFGALGAAGAVVYLGNGTLELAASRGLHDDALDTHRARTLSADDPVPLARAVRCKELVWLDDRAAISRAFPELVHGLLDTPELQASIAVPLLVGDRSLGVMGFSFTHRFPRTRQVEDFLLTVAHHCSLALQRALAFDEVVLAQRDMERLARVMAETAVACNSATSIAGVLSVVNERARELIGAHQSVASITADRSWAQAINAVSLSEKYAQYRSYTTPSNGAGIYALVCESNRPMRLTQDELETHPRWRGFGGEAARHPPMRGWLVAPLVGRDGRNLGLMQLSDKYVGEFTARDEHVLVQLAQMASVAIENTMLFDALRGASQAKDEFLAILGHELRNPLSPILTALELMRLRGSDALLKERTIIERQVQHVVRLVDDLLDVSRIARGKVELKKRSVELADVLGKAIEMSSPLLEQRGHLLSVAVPRLGLTVLGDELRLAQVFSNILTNAAKYTPPGGRIEISAEARGAGEDGMVVIRIRDSGLGISADLLPHVFELFAQGERAIDRSEGGLGLGLTIVRALVEQHDGTVIASSDGPGKGSEFTVRLPLARTMMAAATPPRGISADELAQVGAEPDGPRVLVVDDNRDAAEALVEALSMIGFATRVAFDGPHALELAADFKPQVALLDIGLPVMDGFELARRLRDLSGLGKIQLVAITGYGQEQDRRRSSEAGFVEHLVKPVELARLLQLIHTLIQN